MLTTSMLERSQIMTQGNQINSPVQNVLLICYKQKSGLMDPAAVPWIHHCICPEPCFTLAISKKDLKMPMWRLVLLRTWVEGSPPAWLKFLRTLLQSYTLHILPFLLPLSSPSSPLPISSVHLPLLPPFCLHWHFSQ